MWCGMSRGIMWHHGRDTIRLSQNQVCGDVVVCAVCSRSVLVCAVCSKNSKSAFAASLPRQSSEGY